MKLYSLQVIDDKAVLSMGFDLGELNDVGSLRSLAQIACSLAPDGEMRDRAESAYALVRELYMRAVDKAAKATPQSGEEPKQ